ncbi:MAG: phosphopentomutase [Lachnospiraceae bacterium]|nr:phosphopentomutase [Lachnospiraceae bacterium]
MKRAIIIVLDSAGCGAAPDADKFGDEGCNTIRSCAGSTKFDMKNMAQMGYFNIEGMGLEQLSVDAPTGSFARLRELSNGKDTTTGHWELAGIVSENPMPTYPNGFPEEVIKEFEEAVGRKTLCNLPYSGTKVIEDYGREHLETGALIVYTSADSVFQIAAHEDIVPVETLYEYCSKARSILRGKHAVGRVIARPFTGEPGSFVRTVRRHDFSLEPVGRTMLDVLKDKGRDVLAVGKINDIFAGVGVTDFIRTEGNPDGIDKTISWLDRDFDGLMFVNLVDTDMIYGHRRDIDGYAKALSYFDSKLPEITGKLRDEDILMITADHGCDPGFKGTDHTREYVPLLMYGKNIRSGVDYGTVEGFNSVAATALSFLGETETLGGKILA